MHNDTRLAKRETQETDQRTLETIFGMIPGNVDLKDARILWDAVFYTQESVAAKHGVCRATVNRTVQNHRAVYLELVDAKKQIIGELAQSVLYSALRILDKYLQATSEIKNVKEAALLTQTATQLQRIVEACPERKTRYTSLVAPPELDAVLATAGQYSGQDSR